MPEKKVRLTSLTLAMSLGFMTTLAGCEINPDGGGKGGEGGEGSEQGTVIEQPTYLLSSDAAGGEYESN